MRNADLDSLGVAFGALAQNDSLGVAFGALAQNDSLGVAFGALAQTTLPSAPEHVGSAPSARGTDWGPLLAIVAFVVVSSVIMGWIGWKKRND